MMDRKDRNSIIKQGNLEIQLHKYSDISDEVFVKTIEENVEISRASGKTDQLLLLDISNTYISTKVLEAFKKASVDIKPFTRKTAIIGIKGVQKVFFKVVQTFSKSNNLKSFNTKEEAINWLIQP